MDEQKKRPKTAVMAFMQALQQQEYGTDLKQEDHPAPVTPIVQRPSSLQGTFNALSEVQLYTLPSGKKCRFLAKTIESKKCKVWAGNARDQNKISRDELEALKTSISAQGQLVPILARPNRDDANSEFSHEIIYGSRRLRACQELNLPIKIIEADIPDEDAVFFMDAENASREDLSIYERAMIYKRWLDDKVFRSQEDLAQKIGISRQWVIKSLALLKFPDYLLDALPKYKDLTKLRADKLRSYLSKYPAMEERLKASIKTLATENPNYSGDELFETIFNEFKKNNGAGTSNNSLWEERELFTEEGEKILTIKTLMNGKLKLEVSSNLSSKKAAKLIENLEKIIKRL